MASPRHVIILGHASLIHEPLAAFQQWYHALPTRPEIWGINNPPHWAWGSVAFDRTFQIHQAFSLSASEQRWLTQTTAPVYVCDPSLGDTYPTLDRHAYPLEAVLAQPGVPPGGGWLSCSMCYAIALACLEAVPMGLRYGKADETPVPFRAPGADPALRLTLYGIELQGGSTRERLVEHAGVLWWSGYAAGLGIPIDTPEWSRLFHYPYPYGAAYYAEGDFARHRVKGFLAEAKKESRDKFLKSYDLGMQGRDLLAKTAAQINEPDV